MTEFRTLQPGLLVNMNTSVKGNVTYQVNDRDVRYVDRSEITDIHTRKLVADIDEQERAIKERTKIRGLILSVCAKSEFALLCPNDREAELREAIAEGRTLAEKFNANASTTHIEFRVICGRIAQDDVETVRAITSEIRSLMEDMQRGVKALDVKVIRAAANQATEVGKMLSPEAKGRVAVAIKAARDTARKIAKAGEVAGQEIDRGALRKIGKARTSFLDINTEVAELAEPKAQGRNIDLSA
jgi:hypothetical protein